MAKTGPETLNGFLDRGSRVKGELHFETLMRIDGHVEGKILSTAHVVVGETAEIDGEIEVGRATLGGTVRGSVRAKERIEILKGAKVYADLQTPVLCIEEGALFEGRSQMSAEPALRSARGGNEGGAKLSAVQSS